MNRALLLALDVLGEQSVRSAEKALEQDDVDVATKELRIAEACRRLVGGVLPGDWERNK